MVEPNLTASHVAAIRSGDEALDRGLRGPALELAILRDAGLLGAPLPVDDGGSGWGTSPDGALPMLDVLVALGGASLPVARLYEGHANAIKLVAAFGSAKQRERVAFAVHAGSLLGVWGADGDTPVTVDDGQRLTGNKAFASGVGDIGLAIVTAKSQGTLQMVLVDATDATRGRPESWDVDAMVGSRSGRFDCANLPAGDSERLGQPDALFAEPAFHGGLWRLSACYAGALGRIARLLAELLDSRGLRSLPQTRHRLGLVAVEAEGALLWATNACLAVELGEAASNHAVRAALFSREAIEQAADRALALCERAAGTAMHRRTSELGRLARDLRFYLRQADLDGKLAMATEHWFNGDQACES